jgi:alginate O-acetyltransferase complex protein AlgI
MTFTERPFWYLTAATFALWLLCRRSYPAKIAVLLMASLVFYGYHYWPLLFLILAYCLVDWLVGYRLAQSSRPRWWLIGGVTFNLLVLGFWKYTPILLRTAGHLTSALNWPSVTVSPGDWVIPFGISFYAFTGIAYMVDVYRRTTPAETSFWRYTLSAMFFPHLVAGPILRPSEFLEKLRPEAMPDRPEAPLEALQLLASGFFKKMVIADRIALAIDPFFFHVADASTAGVWALPFVYLYALQIYFDFSGYTDIARGLGLMFGFRWPDNFSLPYLATSVQAFWRRWHVTLSLFLKDYLYVPLGGNRLGPWRTQFNLMVTMLLGGLWHGASWSFLIWGGLHGVYLVICGVWCQCRLRERLNTMRGASAIIWRLICIALTFHCVCLAWCFFRLTVFSESLICVQKWFVFDAGKLFTGGAADASLWLLLVGYGTLMMLARYVDRAWPVFADLDWPCRRGFQWGAAATILLLALLLSPGGERPAFIYFQF